MIKAKGYIKFSEVDIFEDGCQPDTAKTEFDDFTEFKGETKEEFLSEIKKYFDVDSDSLLLDSCDEVGRIDVERMERKSGAKATNKDIELWKLGQKSLYAVIYSIYAQEIKPVSFVE